MQRNALSFLLAAFCAAPTLAQVQPNAGPDQSVTLDVGATLAGALPGRSPLAYWTADGNAATENAIVFYDDATGATASPVLHDAAGKTFGWPSDLLEIDGLVYGIESLHRYLYTVDVTTGLCKAIGPANSWKNVYSLAYDPATDRIFAVDQYKKQLLRIARTTGKVTGVGGATLKGYTLVRALAFRTADAQLYAVDQGSDKLLRLNPTTGVVSVVRTLPADAFARIDELHFFGDDLYGTNAIQNAAGDLIACQLQRIPLTAGVAPENVGPVIPEVSPHALVIHSVPERFQWSQTSGPGVATFSNAQTLTPSVGFSVAGVYGLTLTAFTLTGPVSDSVTITVAPAP
ncbi:MAG: hypothetical protein HZA52_21470 [Planctomycetes bacterium]|nr:hypothetical protein [Planctomycetota bacterium]